MSCSAGATSSSSERKRGSYPVAFRVRSRGGKGSNDVLVIFTGVRSFVRTYLWYGTPLTRWTISPSSWYARFEYFHCVLGGTVVEMSAARASVRAGSLSYMTRVQSVPGGSLWSPDSWESIRRIVSCSSVPDAARELRDVLDRSVVEVELARVAKLHDRGRGEGLRDRRDPIERLRRRAPRRPQVREADPLRPHELAFVDDADRRSGQPVLLHERRGLRLVLRCPRLRWARHAAKLPR